MTMNAAARPRRARLEDVGAMTGLLGQLFRIESDFEIRPERQAAGLRLLLADATSVTLVAEDGGAIAGMASLQVLISTAEGGRVGLVEDLVVDEGRRGRGIGTALLSALEEEASRLGLLRLQLLADVRNSPAAAFYRERGWAATSMGAWKKILRPC